MKNREHIDQAGFERRISQYLEWSLIRGYSEQTRSRAIYNLQKFSAWCEQRGVMRPHEVTRPVIQRFQRFLFHSINPRTDKPLGRSTQMTILANLRSFYRWLIRQNHILYNPAADIDMPRYEKKIPSQVLTKDEVERVMQEPDINTPMGLRDRTVLETIYSSGLRRLEICKLNIDDVDLEGGIIWVRFGKGNKSRVVPVGERGCWWIRTYLDQARPRLLTGTDDGALFLSHKGSRISKDRLSEQVARYIKSSGIKKKGSCHIFRHTCATLMLEGGADVRFVQSLLGHAKLSTTAIYTHVAIGKLKEIHSMSHPGAKLKPDNQNS